MSNSNINLQTQSLNALHNAIMEAGSKDHTPMVRHPGSETTTERKDNDIYSTFLLQLQPEWQRFVTLVKQSQELKTVSYHKLYDILKQHQNEVNEIRAERLARTANPLALVCSINNQLPSSHHPKYKTHNNPPQSQQSGTGYDNQRAVNIAGARENVGTSVVQKSGIQCYNYKEYGHVSRECQKPKRTISDMKKELYAHQETISIMSQAKEAQIKLYKTHEDKELDKVIALENKVKFCKNLSSSRKPQRANPRLYDIGCYNDNLALMLAPESDETIRLDKESRSKLSDLIRPFDYDQLNNLYDLFVPQREKSPEQHYFPRMSKMSHTSSNNEFSKESFRKQTTLLEKRMERIPFLGIISVKALQELFEDLKRVCDNTIFDGVERCKQTIAKETCFWVT
ncbi:integrase, catalytic region, zinc finger, CCHC-type containing protein [Tanacetum coccineum]